jgi:hypothetical protein
MAMPIGLGGIESKAENGKLKAEIRSRVGHALVCHNGQSNVCGGTRKSALEALVLDHETLEAFVGSCAL